MALNIRSAEHPSPPFIPITLSAPQQKLCTHEAAMSLPQLANPYSAFSLCAFACCRDLRETELRGICPVSGFSSSIRSPKCNHVVSRGRTAFFLWLNNISWSRETTAYLFICGQTHGLFLPMAAVNFHVGTCLSPCSRFFWIYSSSCITLFRSNVDEIV